MGLLNRALNGGPNSVGRGTMFWWAVVTVGVIAVAFHLALLALYLIAVALQRPMSLLHLDRFTWSWRFWLWPFLILELLADLLMSMAINGLDFSDRVEARFWRLTEWRVVRFAIVVGLWLFVDPWRSALWPPFLRVDPGNGPYAIPVLFFCVYWPAAALLGWATRSVPPETLRITRKYLISILSIGYAFWLFPKIPPPEWTRGFNTDLLTAVMVATYLFMGFITVLLLVSPLWIFWRRTPAPLGPKYGDAQFANPTALKSQGVVDER